MATDRTRNPVTQGGMWNTAKPQYSKQTHDLLKEMMKESKLTNFQQRQLGKAVQDGQALPRACNPTTSAKPKVQRPPTKKENSLVIDPKLYNPTVRTQEAIEATGAYERDRFHAQPQTKFGGFYEKDKARLANMMAYGEDIEPQNYKPVRRDPREVEEQAETDRFEELEKEIAERQRFLAEMEALGQGDKFRTIVATEVSRLIREMEVIDKHRSSELQRLIAAEEKRQQQLRGDIPKPTVS